MNHVNEFRARSVTGFRAEAPPLEADSRWFATPFRVAVPCVRLFCFPYAGAGASVYFSWSRSVAQHGIEGWNVQLPGRENRIVEPPFLDFVALIGELVGVIDQRDMGVPFAFFGHSLGAVIAHALACELSRLRRPTPCHLFVSGRNAPHHPRAPERIHELSDPELVGVIARYGNLSDTTRDEPELMAMLVPVLRADFTLIDAYYRTRPPVEETPMLPCPVSAFGGEADPWTSRRGLSDWGHYTSGAFKMRTYPGGHFFLNDARDGLCRAIREDLAAAPSLGAGRP